MAPPAEQARRRAKELEGDLKAMRSLPSTESHMPRLEAAAAKTVEGLERTHRALVELLAQAAMQPDSGIEAALLEAADELETLAAAVQDVEGATRMAT